MKRKDEKSCQLNDIVIPTDRNISTKVTEKLSKYKDLEIQIERMWGMKTKTITIPIRALGVIKKESKKYLDDIPANIRLQDQQKNITWYSPHPTKDSINKKDLIKTNPSRHAVYP